ncbi:c-type cytochrome biogenesis protein CcmI [Marivivens sp. LCG002]|uniref:c-type cytochrome biogenesis protein CcmI n=1 Tax=Marivivens sp. LCG002 TaxID=3051171 RepID=UPI00255216F5|nr:c-type cytochrome biogenesis protein CcmI [Marivivens sp. LCG002]WIV49585.1 c-type cytochrome biogenesis protein CcmI [Marivivens sp. LCG002]
MFFWIISMSLAVIATVSLLLPLFRNTRTAATEDAVSEVDIYREQLAEVERDLERGVLDTAEAERTRTEIARRLLAADKAGSQQTGDAPLLASRMTSALFGVVVVALSAGLYLYVGAPGAQDLPLKARIAAGDDIRANRMSQAEAEELAQAMPRPEIDAPADYLEMVQQLRDIVPTRPDDQAGWRLLARHEAALTNYAAAAAAQAHLVDLVGAQVQITDLERLADYMVAATAGLVTPEAEAVSRQILERDTDNIAARYYLGLLYAQTDRPDVAFRLWKQVIDNGTPEQIHVELAKGQIEDAAWRAGVEYELPRTAALPGPTADQIEDAANMSAEDQGNMIQGMVGRLMDRLANEGGTPEEWARLINALGVIGDTDRALAIWTEAQGVFAGNTEALTQIRAAAQSAGVAQ